MSFTAPDLPLIKPGETPLIFIYATSANGAVASHSISGASVKNWENISADPIKVSVKGKVKCSDFCACPKKLPLIRHQWGSREDAGNNIVSKPKCLRRFLCS